MRYFCMGTFLRGFVEAATLPETNVYKEMQKSFNTAFQSNLSGTGTLINDLLAFKPTIHLTPFDFSKTETAHGDLYHTFLHRVNCDIAPENHFTPWDQPSKLRPELHHRVQSIPSIQISGIDFEPAFQSTRHSFITFRSSTDGQSASGDVLAGQIDKIFLHSRTTEKMAKESEFIVEAFVVVKEYEGLSHEHLQNDPFLQIPDLEARLYYNSFKPENRVLKVTDIIGHFSAFIYTPEGIDRECIVVRSLDRVSLCLFHLPIPPR